MKYRCFVCMKEYKSYWWFKHHKDKIPKMKGLDIEPPKLPKD